MSETSRTKLLALYAQIEARVTAIQADHARWPCRRGCDFCCRSLGAMPAWSRAEWEYLWEGFQQLPLPLQADIRAHVARLSAPDTRAPFTCPFLHEKDGSCQVYHHRPAACRTYGFYLEGATGCWCNDIDALSQRLDREQPDQPVIWGNQRTIDQSLERISGAPLSIPEWFAAHPPTETPSE